MNIIFEELREHGGFTLAGAVFAVLIMFLIRLLFPAFLSVDVAKELFEFTHPLHVILSAFVTAALFNNYQGRTKKSLGGYLAVFAVGYIGAIGIATLSDSIVPYFGEVFLGLEHPELHIGIIEMPLLINFAAIIGIFFSYFFRNTHFPHTGHVFLSTAASLFHVMQAQSGVFSVFQSLFLIGFLFFAVWLPCCLSDIVFPLVFVKKK